MPQLNKGGKFIFGLSKIQKDLVLQFPEQAIKEYNVNQSNKIIVFTGSKSTGGFCVTNKIMLESSKLAHILDDLPELANYELPSGKFIHYKGRSYSWVSINIAGRIKIPEDMMNFLHLFVDEELLSIRSSDIAFTMGAYGTLLDKASNYKGEIPKF